MTHLIKTGNNGPRCIEYRVYLIISIRFTIMKVKPERCTTCENWSIIALVAFKTCPICPSVDKLLGRLLMRLTSSSTFFMNSSIFSLSPDLEMPERTIFIFAARMPLLSVRSKLVSRKTDFSMHALLEQRYYSPFSSRSTTFPSCFPTRT